MKALSTNRVLVFGGRDKRAAVSCARQSAVPDSCGCHLLALPLCSATFTSVSLTLLRLCGAGQPCERWLPRLLTLLLLCCAGSSSGKGSLLHKQHQLGALIADYNDCEPGSSDRDRALCAMWAYYSENADELEVSVLVLVGVKTAHGGTDTQNEASAVALRHRRSLCAPIAAFAAAHCCCGGLLCCVWQACAWCCPPDQNLRREVLLLLLCRPASHCST